MNQFLNLLVAVGIVYAFAPDDLRAAAFGQAEPDARLEETTLAPAPETTEPVAAPVAERPETADQAFAEDLVRAAVDSKLPEKVAGAAVSAARTAMDAADASTEQ